MSNGPSNGGAPRDPSHGADSSGAQDGYPTQPVPPQQGRPGPPSGPSQQGYPPQAPRGYAQPGQPGPPQGYGPPPQGGQYGQPPQGYGPQYPPGSDQGQSAYTSPPKKSHTAMIVAIAVIVALILTVAVWLGLQPRDEAIITPSTSAATAVQTPDGETTPAEPTESPDPTQSTEPEVTTVPQDPETDGGATTEDLPLMPEQVGDYTAQGNAEPKLTLYVNEDSLSLVAIHVGIGVVADYADVLDDPTEFGAWTCGVEPESGLSMCLGEAFGGVLSLTGDTDTATIAVLGDEFLTLWK